MNEQTIKPFVSVIVPTYHDWDRLLLCIEALKKQTYPSEYFEVIIINNDPADKSQDLDIPDSWKLITENKPGSYAARNAGIKKSRGVILAFTDADCIPYPDWIENAVSILHSDSDIKRVAGRIELHFRSDQLTPAEIYEKICAFPQKEYASNGYSTTANMFTYKSVFDTVGLFNDSMMSGGDVEWGCRANMMGFKIAYGMDCVVGHPARYKISDLTRKIKRISGGNLVIDRISGKRPYWFFLDLLPPLIWAINVTKDSHLRTKEKFIAFVIHYFLNLTRFWYKMLISLGFTKAPRE
jgi:glycosyltransferase involved in cell wall biosynthesis